MIYLASPYTHSDPYVREKRYLAAMEALAKLLKEGRWTYSPIVHCHELAKIADLPRDAEFWKQYNFAMLAKCDEVRVLCVDGWADSKGIQLEILEATRLTIHVEYHRE